MKVIDLGAARQERDLLRDWEEVRKCIQGGGIKGFALCLLNDAGRETVYLAGTYKANAGSAAEAGLRMSWLLTQRDGTQP